MADGGGLGGSQDPSAQERPMLLHHPEAPRGSLPYLPPAMQGPPRTSSHSPKQRKSRKFSTFLHPELRTGLPCFGEGGEV